MISLVSHIAVLTVTWYRLHADCVIQSHRLIKLSEIAWHDWSACFMVSVTLAGLIFDVCSGTQVTNLDFCADLVNLEVLYASGDMLCCLTAEVCCVTISLSQTANSWDQLMGSHSAPSSLSFISTVRMISLVSRIAVLTVTWYRLHADCVIQSHRLIKLSEIAWHDWSACFMLSATLAGLIFDVCSGTQVKNLDFCADLVNLEVLYASGGMLCCLTAAVCCVTISLSQTANSWDQLMGSHSAPSSLSFISTVRMISLVSHIAVLTVTW